MPYMVGIFGSDDRCSFRYEAINISCYGRRFTGNISLLKDTTNRGLSEMKTSPGKCLSNLDLAHGRTQGFQPLDDITSEVGELVHRFGHLDQGRR